MSENSFSCCGGKSCCGGAPSPDEGLNRRDFMKVAAASGLGAAALFDASAAAEAMPSLETWNASLLERGEMRVYRGDELEHIAMPMGGAGAGQIYLRGDGTLNPWQNFNNFNSNANVPESFFAVRANSADGKVEARLLQLAGRDAVPGVKSIEFSGEYPFAWLRYLDDSLPVQVSLESYSPFIPLNTKDSGLPAILFRFRIRNSAAAPVEVSILSAVPNLIGWDGYARPEAGLKHSEFGGNVNTLEQRNGAVVLTCSSREGATHAFAGPVRFYSGDSEATFHMRHCTNLTVHFARPMPKPDTLQAGDVIWAADINGRLSETELAGVLDQVEAGANAVITCDENALLHDALRKQGKAADLEVFEDFESGSYANLKLEGDCFGNAPAEGTLPGQQQVSGFSGKYLLNTFVNGDGTSGKAVTRAFTIEKRFIHLLVGGGSHVNETCVNLKVEGNIVASERGQDTENLRAVKWDVSGHRGKSAVLEIVDANTGGWGHILIDDIVFTDAPRLASANAALMERYRAALPFHARGTKPYAGKPQALKPGSVFFGDLPPGGEFSPAWTAGGFKLAAGAEVLLRSKKGVPLIVAGKFGKGNLIVCNGAIERWFSGNDRKAIIGKLVARATGAAYTPQTGIAPDSPLAGTMCLGLLDSPGVTANARLQSDSFADLWAQFHDGALTPGTSTASAQGFSWVGALAGTATLAPNEEKALTFVLAWHLPNRTRDDTYGWGPGRFQYDHRLGNQYNNWFKSAVDVVDYVASNADRLDEETRRFNTTFYNSTLPQYFLDAVTANASIVRSPIYVWLEDGTVGGFEGADRCCPMNCTHVYNYAMSAAYLFPALERNVRETDLLVQMHPTEHYIPHRTVLPLSLPRLGKKIGGPEHPALDGELSTVVKTYREWLMYGDRAWLEKVYDRVRALMLYIMKEHDTAGEGVFRGEQPNTYDTHIYGSNTFIGTQYLAALRAAEEMARLMNDGDNAKLFRERFEKGRVAYDQICWNGEYYINVFDAPNADDKTYNSNNCFGPGCFSDQLLGQWWALVLGLGYVLPPERVKQTLQAIHRYNWRADLTGHKHTQRVFASGNEKGLLVGSWPKGGRPERPILYCDEVWTGVEYQVAATMIYEGMITEGLQIVRGARERYTGNQRNPWSEIECGGHYARAMSSYSLMNAAAGLLYDAGKASLAMAPRITPENFKAFFTADKSWGAIAQQRIGRSQRNSVSVRYGSLTLRQIAVDVSHEKTAPRQIVINAGSQKVRGNAVTSKGLCTVSFAKPVELQEGNQLRVELRWA